MTRSHNISYYYKFLLFCSYLHFYIALMYIFSLRSPYFYRAPLHCLVLLLFILFYNDTTEAQAIATPVYHQFSTADSSLDAQAVLRSTAPQDWAATVAADFHFGYSQNYHWIKLELPANALSAAAYFWVLDAPTIQNARLYAIRNDSVVSSFEAGTDFPFAHRLINHRHFLLPFSTFSLSTTQQPITLLLRVHNDIGTVVGSLSVRPQATFEYYDVRIRLAWVLLIVLFSLASVIATGFHLALRERVYAHYAFYILSALGFVLTFSGLGYQFVWYDYPRFAFACKAFWMLSEAIFLMLFVYRLFYTHATERPQLRRIIYGLSFFMLFFIVLLLLPIPLHNVQWLTPFANGSIFAAIIVVIKIIYDNIKLRNPAAYYFLLSFAPVLLGAVMMLLRNLNIYTNDWLMSPFLMPVLHCVEIFLLFIALLKRMQTTHISTQKLRADLADSHRIADAKLRNLATEIAALRADTLSRNTKIDTSETDTSDIAASDPAPALEPNANATWQLSEERQLSILLSVYTIMQTEKAYLNADLTLAALANRLELSPTYLSQVINQREGLSFNDFVNKYRIDAAKAMLIDTNIDFSIEGVGTACGFNSKSTFFTAFRKHANCTPAEYKRQIR